MNELEKLGWKKVGPEYLNFKKEAVESGLVQVYTKHIYDHVANPEITFYAKEKKVEFCVGNFYNLTFDEINAINKLALELEQRY